MPQCCSAMMRAPVKPTSTRSTKAPWAGRLRSRVAAAATDRIRRAARFVLIVLVTLPLPGLPSGAAPRTPRARAGAAAPAPPGGTALKLSAEVSGYGDSDAVFV